MTRFTTRKKNEPEHEEAKALMKWCELSAKAYPGLELLYHIPNGGERNKIVAGKLKAEGVMAGVPDYFLSVPLYSFHGLYIELKAPTGDISDAQDILMPKLAAQGYYVAVAWGWEAARDVIIAYFKNSDRVWDRKRDKVIRI
ncbi:VRR-NUC domain-containing protein [Candidatus Pacearchaeota archaeon]|nr:VRR-NUC domain-containing protein [Candidatus Pacearchaeota archaeon]